ncbi:MAG: hypothetical protein A2Y79_12130 [Deltaproteobacteria bacterium RBG_13_43_22]|nr:MAG: hypothetical protein A2Y79_12130 [Deltaproteobacteria bacterium RBG_13_43_22]
MCCEMNIQRPQNRQGMCGCGCTGMSRRFLSAQEAKDKLEEYQEQLRKDRPVSRIVLNNFKRLE